METFAYLFPKWVDMQLRMLYGNKLKAHKALTCTLSHMQLARITGLHKEAEMRLSPGRRQQLSHSRHSL